MTAASAGPDSSGGAPVREGDVLASKYRVEKVLGIGGMGVVVAATHVDLDQRVALKFLLPAAASNEELVGRFMREARASVRLKGRHVVKVLDVGRLEDDAPYIVMEFLEGSDLAAVMKSRPPGTTSIEEAVTYMLHACEGLAEAHSYGIIHRDLKPGNLFLTRGVDGKPLVKVLDFGISKTIDRSITGEAASLTKTEMLLGSPLYMSPEQMRSSKHVDERADIWALGALMYEMLTGTVPFIADTIMGLCFAVAQEEPKDPREVRPDIPEDLAKAILHCLEKDPANRFSNVAELASAIEPFGPQRTRGTGERALDVLGTGKRKPMRSLSPDVDQPVTPSNPTTDPTLAAASLGAAPMARSDLTPAPNAVPNPHVAGFPFGSTSDPAMQAAPAPGVSQGDVAAQAAWGGTRAEPLPKAPAPSKRTWVLPVAAAAVLVGALGGVAFFKGLGSPPATNNLSSSSTTPPPSAVATVAPSGNAVAAGGAGAASATPAPSESVQSAGVSPTASTSASATPALPGKITPGRPTGTTTGSGGKGTKPAGSAPAAASVAPVAPTSAATQTAAPAGSGFLRVRE